MKDYYYILGLDKNASKEEIKQAYRKLSQKFHPDKNPDDKFWENRFKDISEAHETLINDAKRKIYDEELAASTNNYDKNYSQHHQSTSNQSYSGASNVPPQTPPVSTVKKRTISISSIVIILVLIGRIATCSQEFAKTDAENKAVQKILSDSTTSTAEDSSTIISDSRSSTTDTTSMAPATIDSGVTDNNSATQNADDNSTVTPVPADITNIYEVKWITNFVPYRAALILQAGGVGKMRVKYFAGGNENLIEETIKLEHTDEGNCLKSYNPVYAVEQITVPRYSPDNIYISQDENGNPVYKLVDNNGSYMCDLSSVTGDSNIENFLADFKWKSN